MKKKNNNNKKKNTCIFPLLASLARYWYDNVIRLFRAALLQNWRLTYMFATNITLLLELSCLHSLSSLFDFLYKYNMVCVPTTNNLNRTFLLEYYPFFFNILKLVLRKAVRVISTSGIHTGICTSMHICHDIFTSVLCSKTFSWLVGCIIVLRSFDTF